MNIMKKGTSAFIYDQSLQILGSLPPASCWKVEYDDHQGAFLVETDAPSKPEMKVYGDHDARAGHILRAYQSREGAHTGVILSGAKGIGKTLFARILALKAMGAGYPVIRVDKFVPDLAEFLASIKQDACILFDEFDKTFTNPSRDVADSTHLQHQLLGFFDGVTKGHMLCILTCNDLTKVNEFLVNRPGRIRYHLRFQHPMEPEVKAFMSDSVPGISEDDLTSLTRLAQLFPLSYDCLTAIAEEMRMTGGGFRDAMEMLNLVSLGTDSATTFKVEVILKHPDKEPYAAMLSYNERLNVFDDRPRNMFSHAIDMRHFCSDVRLLYAKLTGRTDPNCSPDLFYVSVLGGSILKRSRFDGQGLVMDAESFDVVNYYAGDKEDDVKAEDVESRACIRIAQMTEILGLRFTPVPSTGYGVNVSKVL
jgi:hypothetical protein